MATVTLTINGEKVTREVENRRLLVQLLREDLRMTGTHVGCDTTQCGCCTVLFNGDAVKSCTVLAHQANRHGGKAAPGAASVPREARTAVRVLHAWHGDEFGRSAAEKPEPQRARRAALARGQPLPLHGLPQHRGSSSACSRHYEGEGLGRVSSALRCVTDGFTRCTVKCRVTRARATRSTKVTSCTILNMPKQSRFRTPPRA